MDRPFYCMNRLAAEFSPLKSLLNLQAWILIFVMICIMQISESLDDATIAETLIYWAARLSVLIVSVLFSKWLLFHAIKNHLEQPAWLKPLLLLTVVAAVPMTVVELYLEFHFPMTKNHDDSVLWAQTPVMAALGEYLTIMSYLFTINLIIWLMIQWRHQQPTQPQLKAKEPIIEPPLFMTKVPHLNFNDVLAINAEGHYIRIHFATGSELINYVFKQAINEVAAHNGIQTHRSWWVARDAVVKAHKSGKRYQLILSHELKVPVSDTYFKPVKAMGLLQNRQ